MEAKLHLFVQPQKELQPDLKTNNTQNYQKIELYRSVTFIQMGRRGRIMGWVGGSVTQKGGSGSDGADGPTFMYGG